jgi:hypothetical protein
VSIYRLYSLCYFTDQGPRRNTEKERQNLQSDRERRNTILRAHETELHQLQLRENDLRSQVREKESLKQGVEVMRLEMNSVTSELKVNRRCPLHKQRIDLATRNWTFKYWKARVPLTLWIENMKPRKQNPTLSYLRLSKWLKNSVKVPTNLGALASILNGECPAAAKCRENR